METGEHTVNILVFQIMLIFINISIFINICQHMSSLAFVQKPTTASYHDTTVKTLQDVFR